MTDYCLWNLCNNNCIMCTNPPNFRCKEGAKDYEAQKVLGRIESDKKMIANSGSDINLTGGEPTIHPEFISFLKKIREKFPQNTIAFSSNGRRFFYENFTRELLEIDRIRVHIVVHSSDEKIHDSITRVPGSFQQTIKGLENIFKYKNDSHMVELRVVLLKQNYKEIDNLYELFYNKFSAAGRVCTIFPEYEGIAEKNFDFIKITFPEVKPYIENSLEKWRKRFNHFYLFHFPLCAINHNYWDHLARSLPPNHPEIFFMEKCEKCFYKDSCLGVYKDYVKHFGENHFSPIINEIPIIKKNQHDYHRPILKIES